MAFDNSKPPPEEPRDSADSSSQPLQRVLSGIGSAIVSWWNFGQAQENGWVKFTILAGPFIGIILVIGIISSSGGGGDSSDIGRPSGVQVQPDQSRPSSSSTSGGYSEDDVAYKLAVVDKGGFVATDDSSISSYERALDRAASKCTEGRLMVADMAVGAQQIIEERGGRAGLLELLSAIDAAVPPEAAPMTCSEVLATLVVLMTPG